MSMESLKGPLCGREERNHERYQTGLLEGRENRGHLWRYLDVLVLCSSLWTLNPIAVNEKVLWLQKAEVRMREHRHRISQRKEANCGCHCLFHGELSASHNIDPFLFIFTQANLELSTHMLGAKQHISVL